VPTIPSRRLLPNYVLKDLVEFEPNCPGVGPTENVLTKAGSAGIGSDVLRLTSPTLKISDDVIPKALLQFKFWSISVEPPAECQLEFAHRLSDMAIFPLTDHEHVHRVRQESVYRNSTSEGFSRPAEHRNEGLDDVGVIEDSLATFDASSECNRAASDVVFGLQSVRILTDGAAVHRLVVSKS